jgi:tRNA threonylcarbamoyladenosine biosynthesis protein TsaE
MRYELFLPSATETEALGRRLALVLAPGDVVALHGDLGAGKTTLARGLIRALCPAITEVPSPTYTLVQCYDAPGFQIWHFDLYRLQAPDEVRELGWDEAAGGVRLIEWPDRAGRFLPAARLDVFLSAAGSQRSAALVSDSEHWQEILHEF